MAARYVRELREHSPGPYLLGGYSGGGIVAIEMARHKPRRCIVLQRPQRVCDLVPGRDRDWAEAAVSASAVQGRVHVWEEAKMSMYRMGVEAGL